MRFTITTILLLFFTITGFSDNLSAYIDYARFRLDDSTSYIEFYIGIDASSVGYVEREGGYQAEVFASIQLQEEGKIRFYEKFNVLSPVVDVRQVKASDRFNFCKRIATRNAVVDCEIVLKDMHSQDTSYTIKMQIDNRFSNEKVVYSDIQLLTDYVPSTEKGDFVKHGYQLNPQTTNFYPNDAKKLSYYLEIYNTDRHFEKEERFVVYTTFRSEKGDLLKEPSKFKQHYPNNVIALLGEIDISLVPSGNFFFIVEIRDKNNELIAFAKKFIQRVNTDFDDSAPATEEMYTSNFSHNITPKKLTYYMECLRPIASELEMSTIRSLIANGDSTQMRNYFFDFWYGRYHENARKEWVKYEMNIQRVDEQYSCFGRPGYLTEQGRVMLKYGPPNRVDTEFTDPTRNAGDTQKEYQIWSYYTIGNFRNRIFVFQKAIAGRCDYDLIHSNMQGELQNQDWMNNNDWRQKMKSDRSGTNHIIGSDQ